jgi:hypothetical protein
VALVNRPLHLLAWVNVLVHLLALALAAGGLRPGSALFGLEQRLAYLAAYPAAWSLGWASWMLCTLAFVAFFAALVRAVPGPADGLRLALVIGTAGGAVDLFCDLIQMTALPALAAAEPPPTALFLTMERVAGAGGLVVANGAYTLATLLATYGLPRRPGLSAVVIAVGWGVFVGGGLLVVAGFTDWTLLAAVGTGPMIGLFCAWVLLVARLVEGPGRVP